MADSYACKGGRKTAGSNKPAASKESRTDARINPPAELPKLGNATSDKTEGKKKGRPKAENQALKDIPLPLMNQWKDEFKAHSRVKCPNSGCWLEFPSIYGLKYHYQRCQGGAISEKLTYSCSHCEAAFTSKTQLEKHRLWNHLDRPVPTSKAENKVQKAIGKSGGKKRAAESSACPTIHPKQAKTEKAMAQDHAENGECLAESRESKEFQIAAAEAIAAATPTAKSSSGKDAGQQGGSQASLQEEDPERMKHKSGRKQKTPKKFTGEQPSISGTFGLKGLVKAEDKAKAHRAKKLEGNTNMEELKKKTPGAGVKKETAAHLPAANPEDQWQREISEKGEVACPTCSVITRKTVVGLKKHMDVCQKLQDALKCQHCKKQFKSKAGLNYHTMAEHVSKGCAANFSSLMGYQYHQKRCGKQLAEADKPVFSCPHCGKKYKSKAGHDYHVRSEHPASVSPPDTSAARGAGPSLPVGDCRAAEPVGRTEPGRAGPGKPPEEPEVKPEPSPVEDFERTPSGRIRRTSAQVAVFHLQEIAEDELAKDWTKRRMKDDLVPETKRGRRADGSQKSWPPSTFSSHEEEVSRRLERAAGPADPLTGLDLGRGEMSGISGRLQPHLAASPGDLQGPRGYRCFQLQPVPHREHPHRSPFASEQDLLCPRALQWHATVLAASGDAEGGDEESHPLLHPSPSSKALPRGRACSSSAAGGTRGLAASCLSPISSGCPPAGAAPLQLPPPRSAHRGRAAAGPGRAGMLAWDPVGGPWWDAFAFPREDGFLLTKAMASE
ncbi:zinc finger protein 512B isoform X3 [Cygnus olor]|uniref:zinc finger protein 512B isoform X3 n=1 Tax=Cygnus olor TaxID=8869 RepID=UPI001ADE3787|nr:zinc finger protein 512B isoform X3 [Cygnus olor]